MHADAEVDMSAVGRVGSICRAAEDGAPDADRRADLAHSIPCATGEILAQPPLRRFTWKLVALRYERRSSIEHIRLTARGGMAQVARPRLRSGASVAFARSDGEGGFARLTVKWLGGQVA
jgi:hypothetical protein